MSTTSVSKTTSIAADRGWSGSRDWEEVTVAEGPLPAARLPRPNALRCARRVAGMDEEEDAEAGIGEAKAGSGAGQMSGPGSSADEGRHQADDDRSMSRAIADQSSTSDEEGRRGESATGGAAFRREALSLRWCVVSETTRR